MIMPIHKKFYLMSLFIFHLLGSLLHLNCLENILAYLKVNKCDSFIFLLTNLLNEAY